MFLRLNSNKSPKSVATSNALNPYGSHRVLIKSDRFYGREKDEWVDNSDIAITVCLESNGYNNAIYPRAADSRSF